MDPAADCRADFLASMEACNDTFNDPDVPGYQNQAAFETCTNGANAHLTACLASKGGNTSEHWDEFIDDIKGCLEDWPDGGVGLEASLRGMLRIYRHRLGLPPEDPCGLTRVGTARVAPMDTLRSAAIDLGHADGVYPVEAQSTLSFQAGISSTNSYNLAARPCIRGAELIALYQTRQGVQAVPLDADTDVSDGVFFDLPVFANRVIDTNKIVALAVYYDDQGRPVFMEYAPLSITPSPIRGDWNRDAVQNSQDIVDFLQSYAGQVERADLNQDGTHDAGDLQEFVDQIDR